VQDGDFIELDVENRAASDVSRKSCVPQDELESAGITIRSGYQNLYVEHVMRASRGADFDFLVGCRATKFPRIF
jgi:dihydroxyacid dehydratase/phosphogluconate dehydratase